jgi:hypothetical protein
VKTYHFLQPEKSCDYEEQREVAIRPFIKKNACPYSSVFPAGIAGIQASGMIKKWIPA